MVLILIFVAVVCNAQWVQVSNGMGNSAIISLAAHGNNIFAGTVGDGIYLSTNNGINWIHTSLYNRYVHSFLVNGNVPSIFNADCMLHYSFPKPSIEIKLGASNVLNNYYYSILGGPQIGGFYYTKLIYSLK